jgi:hypothetical protein
VRRVRTTKKTLYPAEKNRGRTLGTFREGWSTWKLGKQNIIK